MRPILVLTGLLFLASLQFAAFDMKDYLYASESAQDITFEELSTSGTHILYSVSGTPVVITSQDAIVEDQSQINRILSEHYASTLLPSESEISELREHILKFNQSRNFKSRYGPVEDTCLQYTGMKALPCSTLDTCYATANVVCTNFASGGGGGCYPEVLAPLFLDYATQVKIFNDEMPEIFSLLEKVNSSEAPEAISSIVSRIDKVTVAASALEKNELRFPETGDSCKTCYGLCPAPHLDTGSLSLAKTKLNEVSATLLPASGISAKSLSISQNTNARLKYKAGTALLSVWKPKWDSFKKQNEKIRTQATNFATYVKDSDFVAQYKKFDGAWTSMDSRMETLDFDGVDLDMEALQESSKALERYVNSSQEHPYKKTLISTNKATDAIIYAKYNVRMDDAAAIEAYNSLATRKNQLDAKFAPPMTSAQYEQLNSEYEALISDSQSFVQSQVSIGGSVSSAGGAFGQTAIAATFSLTDAVYAIPPSQKEMVAPAIPPIALLIFDLAALSILIVVFVGVAIKFKPLFKRRIVLGVWVALLLVFLFVLGAGSVMMFILIDQSAKSSTLQDFTSMVSNSNSAYVLVDTTSVPSAQLSSMMSCAKNISGQLMSARSTPTEILEITGDSCKYGTQKLSAQECLDMAGMQPAFMLYSGTENSAKFYTVYQKRAEIYGDSAYYQRCEIGDVLH